MFFKMYMIDIHNNHYFVFCTFQIRYNLFINLKWKLLFYVKKKNLFYLQIFSTNFSTSTKPSLYKILNSLLILTAFATSSFKLINHIKSFINIPVPLLNHFICFLIYAFTCFPSTASSPTSLPSNQLSSSNSTS